MSADEKPELKTQWRVVNVTPESIWRERRKHMRVCFGPEPTFIALSQLYPTLDHGEPGDYILQGV